MICHHSGARLGAETALIEQSRGNAYQVTGTAPKILGKVTPRLAFTLMELLVVISIIGVLAGLLFPAVGMAMSMANDIKCDNNLSQIAKGMTIYAMSNDDLFPFNARDLAKEGFSDKSFICPLDSTRGTHSSDRQAGRPTSWNDGSSGGSAYTFMIETPCSYFFEGSSDMLKFYDTTRNINFVGFFFANYSSAEQGMLPDERKTWQMGKRNQQQSGRPMAGGTQLGASFPSTGVPILRCYHHYSWKATGSENYLKRKVNNLSLALNSFWTIPYWELQYPDYLQYAKNKNDSAASEASNFAVPPP